MQNPGGKRTFGLSNKKTFTRFPQKVYIPKEKQHFRLPLVTGVVGALMGQREILCGDLENPYVYQGASVWRLDRGMEVQ